MSKTPRKQKQLLIRLDPELYALAKEKCQEKWGIGLSPLIKVFLRSFVTQGGVGFYIGDDDLSFKFNNWLRNKHFVKKGDHPFPFPRLKDLYDLGHHN